MIQMRSIWNSKLKTLMTLLMKMVKAKLMAEEAVALNPLVSKRLSLKIVLQAGDRRESVPTVVINADLLRLHLMTAAVANPNDQTADLQKADRRKVDLPRAAHPKVAHSEADAPIVHAPKAVVIHLDQDETKAYVTKV